jgi:SAM-dependent methyltransferase
MGAVPNLRESGLQGISSVPTEQPVTVQSIYLNGDYLTRNPLWHVEESAWKVVQILRMLRENHITPTTVCDVGCGAGEVLKQLQKNLPEECKLYGYDISPQAIDLAKSRANARLHFCLSDVCSVDAAWFDVLLALDVFEHIEDYYGFLRRLKAKARYKIFHIPLDISVQTVFRKSGLLKRRHLHDHLHFFSKETALQALKDVGYEIVDCFYTARGNDLGSELGQRLLVLPRKILFSLHEDFTVRTLGGYSLLVLAR